MENRGTANVGAILEASFSRLTDKNRSYGPIKDINGLEGYELVSVGMYTRETGETYAKAITVKDAGGNVYVHFNGTGDGNWGYNSVAYGGPPSPIQEWSLSYFNDSIAGHYEGKSDGNLYVTGHSQGGNNAQYVTIRSPYADYISACVTLDGPGFSNQFVEESIALYGESYYERQRGKIWAYYGQSDYVSPQGQVEIVPNGHITFVATPPKGPNDNIMFTYHAVQWMLDENGNLNVGDGNLQESEFRQFVRQLVAKINELPEDKRQRAAEIAMKFAENYVGANEPIKDAITAKDFEDFKETLVPVIVELLADNPGKITPLLQESGIDRPAAEAIEDLIRHFNSYPPEVREKALQAIAQGVTFENGEFGFDWKNIDIPAALVTALPILLETALTHPEDIDAVIHELGIDVAVENWIKENPWQFAGICVGLAILSPIIVPIVTVVAVIGIFADAVIRIVQGVSWLANKAKEAIIQAFNAIKNAIGKIAQWLRNTFDSGVRYVNSNPYFKVDTAKLRGYASRIDRVNQRLRNLDSGLRGLYWQVGLLDIWDILCANLLTSGSPTLNQVRSYLNNTADRFETAESKARGYADGGISYSTPSSGGGSSGSSSGGGSSGSSSGGGSGDGSSGSSSGGGAGSSGSSSSDGSAAPAEGATSGGGADAAKLDSFKNWCLDTNNWTDHAGGAAGGIDVDNAYGEQCADISKKWFMEMYGVNSVGLSAWNNAGTAPAVNFSEKSRMADVSGGPYAAGDIGFAINPPNSGHTFVVVSNPDKNGNVQILEQNPSSPRIRSVPMSYITNGYRKK
ncbi:MAG: DUF2974 domain-containing protein [Clostridiales bacterium]|jgi:ElaB/YqjD/DUF883 family membrane-anchored ribosome-binding protein|nr:DUF2974 domain-containing protein [Clostridiales bacterium]